MPMNLKISRLRLACLLLLSLAIVGGNDAQARTHTPKKARKSKIHKVVKNVDEGEFANFVQWKEVNNFVDAMVTKHGFDKKELEAILRKTRYVESSIQLIKPPPPGRPKNW